MPHKPDGLVEHILVNYRWVFVCCFLLPASFFYNIWFYFRNWVVFTLSSAPDKHDERVRFIQKQVSDWNKAGRKKKLCTARPGWQTVSFRRPKYKDDMHQVEVNLVDILEIDAHRKVVRVEPLVTMGQLSATLNPLGWTIPVLPEIDDLTVGGLIMGTGIESSSHRHGLFQHICTSYELVLSDGSVIKATKQSNPDIFYSIPWSYGTIGILTAVEIQIVPAKPYVKLVYKAVKGLKNIVKEFQAVSKDTERNEFVEGLMYSKDEAIIMTGNLTDRPDPNNVNPIGKWYKPWFFIHARNMLGLHQPVTEYIPLRDYYHRHTKSIFWELQDIIPFGNNVIFRYLFGWLVPPKISLLKLTQTAAVKKLYENNHVIQDMLVPISAMEESVKAFHEEFKVYPLWLCPFVLPNDAGMVHPRTQTSEMYIDIGVYGVPTAAGFRPKASTRVIEKLVTRLKG
ncbi:delta(24)-sterol reductase-like isoform X2 [Atheta coriaria]